MEKPAIGMDRAFSSPDLELDDEGHNGAKGMEGSWTTDVSCSKAA
uniref:Uncharacterized protein n=1 Tax=Brassica oleracea TaxID=3712 RepID=A0A3P6B4Y9_BRAOL|nr:unnamed protein product [Brassica oleracea]